MSDDIYQKNILEESLPNNPLAIKEAKRLIDESKKIEISREKNQKTVTKIAVGAAIAFGLISLGLIVTIMVLTPLKTVEPYVVRVDNTTGYVEVLKPLELDSEISEQEAVTRHFVAQYVLARESYDWFMVRHNHQRVQALSSSSVFSVYDRFMRSENSPLTVLGERKRAEVTVTNITIMNNIAQVRFQKRILNSDGTPDPLVPSRNWIATINFEYQNEKLSYSQRLLNPLNFRAVGYDIDLESGVE